MFDLFDSKNDGMIDFGEFVKALSVFHPAAPQPQKAACKSSYQIQIKIILYCQCIWIRPRILKFDSNMSDVMAVAFRLYDIWQRGFIERDEVREMILALLRESDLVLSHDIIELIIDKVFSFFLHISRMINYSFWAC